MRWLMYTTLSDFSLFWALGNSFFFFFFFFLDLWPFAMFGNFYIQSFLARYLENYHTCHISHCEIKSKRPRAEQLALPISDNGVTGVKTAGGEILPEPKQRFIAESLSCSPFLPRNDSNTVERDITPYLIHPSQNFAHLEASSLWDSHKHKFPTIFSTYKNKCKIHFVILSRSVSQNLNKGFRVLTFCGEL